MIDIQSTQGEFSFPIDAVGVNKLKYPMRILSSPSKSVDSTGEWTMSVALPASSRGTHMSRFIEELEETCDKPFDSKEMFEMAQRLSSRLNISPNNLHLNVEAQWFRKVEAPHSGMNSFVSGHLGFFFGDPTNKDDQKPDAPNQGLILKVPLTTLCPCSKAISKRGAHNQRAEVTAKIWLADPGSQPNINFLFSQIESCGSAPVYTLLKREDEKVVTEQAYDNPVFTEDLIRNVAKTLYERNEIKKAQIYVENLESIHNHNCFASLQFTR